MYGLLGLVVCQVFLVVGLDRDDMLCLLVNGASHDCEGALAHLEADLEFFQFKGLLVRILLPSRVNNLSKVSQLLQLNLRLLLSLAILHYFALPSQLLS